MNADISYHIFENLLISYSSFICKSWFPNCMTSTIMTVEHIVSEKRGRKRRHSWFMPSKVSSGSCAKYIFHLLLMPQKELKCIGVKENWIKPIPLAIYYNDKESKIKFKLRCILTRTSMNNKSYKITTEWYLHYLSREHAYF